MTTRTPAIYVVITHPQDGGYFRVDGPGQVTRYTHNFPDATWYRYEDWGTFWADYRATAPKDIDIAGTIPKKESMNVHNPSSAPSTHDANPNAQQRFVRSVTGAGDMLAIRAFSLLVGIPLWIAGAKYTLDGCIRVGNLLLVWLSLAIKTPPGQMPPITNMWVYVGLAGALGLIFSNIEIGQWRTIREKRRIGSVIVLVWLLANAIDIGSTYAGVTAPGVAVFPLQAWVTRTPLVAGVWSAVITYLPETLLVFAFRIRRN